MTRGQTRNNKHKNKARLSQTPDKDIEKETDGLDVEYAEELADAEDLEAQQRSNEADKRAHNRSSENE
ncbi:YfhD family protein [Salibacterium salarium]|uniref:YfhD family protein n=1 Tax=Salibacterium salarium TaxID=284579 RepID=A0A3R9WTM8_9BACI|nr:YfhD family protein [Salibacterium salarium]RSL33328.1 YfhD family protein [Salibacterium salarium]